MPISADQWRVAVGCHNVKRHRQIDLKRFFLEKMIFGGSKKSAQLYFMLQKSAEICHSGTLNGKSHCLQLNCNMQVLLPIHALYANSSMFQIEGYNYTVCTYCG